MIITGYNVSNYPQLYIYIPSYIMIGYIYIYYELYYPHIYTYIYITGDNWRHTINITGDITGVLRGGPGGIQFLDDPMPLEKTEFSTYLLLIGKVRRIIFKSSYY